MTQSAIQSLFHRMDDCFEIDFHLFCGRWCSGLTARKTGISEDDNVRKFLVFIASFINKCTYGRPDFDECVSKNIETVVQLLSEPKKSVGLPSLEPLKIDSFSIGTGTGPVGVQQNFDNANMYGLRDLKIEKLKLSFERYEMTLNGTVFFSNLEIVGQYHLDGRILVLPVQGRGDFTLRLNNLTAVINFPLERVEKNGKVYVQISDAASIRIPKLDLLYMHFENLYDGNKVLGDNVNKVINENWEAIFDDVRSGYEQFFASVVKHIVGAFFNKIAVADMLNNDEPVI